MRIIIIGAGAAGSTLAVDLSSHGHDVFLTELPGFETRLEAIKRGRNELELDGMMQKKATIKTSDISIVKTCDYIFIATVADAHPLLPSLLIPYLTERVKAVVYFPGNLGSLFLKKAMKGRFPSLALVEANSIPYGCRVDPNAPKKIHVSVLTPSVLYSGEPEISHELKEILRQLTPEMKLNGCPLSVFLSNPNPLFHTLPCLMNAGRIEFAQGEFYMYNEGVTPAISLALHAKDKERMKLLAAVPGRGLRWNELRGHVIVNGTKTDLEFLDCGKTGNFKGPDKITHRYITEDTKAGLVCWERIGQLYGISTPIISAEITLISAMLGKNFRGLGCNRADLITK